MSTVSDLYMKLEDVTRRFVKPCIMDVKLGQRSYDPYASQEKREQQIRKYPLMEEIGFLVLGMRVSKQTHHLLKRLQLAVGNLSDNPETLDVATVVCKDSGT